VIAGLYDAAKLIAHDSQVSGYCLLLILSASWMKLLPCHNACHPPASPITPCLCFSAEPSQVFGFLNGPHGIMTGNYVELDDARIQVYKQLQMASSPYVPAHCFLQLALMPAPPPTHANSHTNAFACFKGLPQHGWLRHHWLRKADLEQSRAPNHASAVAALIMHADARFLPSRAAYASF